MRRRIFATTGCYQHVPKHAYLAFEEADTRQDALRGYVAEMDVWVEAVRTGGSLEDVIPVNVPPTSSYADQLEGRLSFLRAEFLEVDPDSVERLLGVFDWYCPDDTVWLGVQARIVWGRPVAM